MPQPDVGFTADVYRFQKEAHAASTLSHPNIVSVFAMGKEKGYHYYVMEFVDGPTLRDQLRDGPITPDEAARCLELVALGIQAVHEKGIVHRDIKPSNILMKADGQPCVTDFGIAKSVENEASVTRQGQIIGTPSYMSPEQAMGRQQIGPGTDVYSLGATLYASLTGRPPFQAGDQVETLIQVRTNDPVRPSLLNSEVPTDLETICLKCLEKESSSRYLTAESLAHELAKFRAGKRISARSYGLLRRTIRWSNRNRMLSAIGVLAVTVTVILLGMSIYYNNRLSQLIAERDEQNAELVNSLRESRRLQQTLRQSLYISDMNIAGRAWQSGDVRQMGLTIAQYENASEM